nr:hypothetical protein [Cyanobacteriota bacterium]
MSGTNGTALPKELQVIEKDSQVEFSNLRAAAERSIVTSTMLRKSMTNEFDAWSKQGSNLENIELLIMGSIARKEVTEGSDCDYLLVSPATPSHESVISSLKAVENVIVKELK